MPKPCAASPLSMPTSPLSSLSLRMPRDSLVWLCVKLARAMQSILELRLGIRRGPAPLLGGEERYGGTFSEMRIPTGLGTPDFQKLPSDVQRKIKNNMMLRFAEQLLNFRTDFRSCPYARR